jgi:tripartite-type tricarboxylate transporter receptor subunit TctC
MSGLPRRQLLQGLGALCSGIAAAEAAALRLTVAYPPGGVSDETARELAHRMVPRLGGPVIVDHRPGAGGTVAMEALSRARADERVLCFSAITPLLHRPQGVAPPRFDPLRDIAPVAAVMVTPLLVVATPAFAGSDFADLIAAARNASGSLRWATSGHGTTGHLVLAKVCAAADVDITHVPYSGGGVQLNDALAGQFEVLSTNVAARQLAYIREGRLRPLAVGAPQRVAQLPTVPTLAELGQPAANLSSLFGVFASARAPTARLEGWNHQINDVLQESSFRERLLAGGHLPVVGSRSAFAQRIADEDAAMRRMPVGTALAPRR